MATGVVERGQVIDLPRRHLRADQDLARTLAGLRAAFGAAPLPLALAGAEQVQLERAQVLEQLDDYLLPRLSELDAPALVVVGGPTGAGKSTLVNSLAGRQVTTPGVLRPTTRSPVLAHHPDDSRWFGAHRILPDLDRVSRPTTDQHSLQLVATTTVPRGLAILDAPDFDSIDDRNRELATKLLAAADLWLFVTSAARYADEVPWQQLSLALERDASVAVVMNRIPAEDRASVSPDLGRMLRDRGIADEQVFFVEQGPVDDDGLLPPAYVAHVRAWLDALATDGSARSRAVRRTVGGAARRAVQAAAPAAAAAELQVGAVSDLLTVADQAYVEGFASLRVALTDGSLLRGGLAARWSELFGRYDVPPLTVTKDFLDECRTRPRPELQERVDRLTLALDLALESVVVDHAERAAGRASSRLRATSHGSALLDWSADDLTRPGRGLGNRTRKAGGSLRRHLGTLATPGTGTTAGPGDVVDRALAAAVTVHALAGDPMGDPSDGADSLVLTAREEIVRSMTALLVEERDRYLQPVLAWELAPDAPGRLRAAAVAVERTLTSFENESGTR